jgi:hypothetical protein
MECARDGVVRMVREMPTVVVANIGAHRVVCAHGAIDALASDPSYEMLKTSLDTKTSFSVRLDPMVAHQIEWNDFGSKSVVRSSRSTVTPEKSLHILRELAATLLIGGHQDYVETFGWVALETPNSCVRSHAYHPTARFTSLASFAMATQSVRTFWSAAHMRPSCKGRKSQRHRLPTR